GACPNIEPDECPDNSECIEATNTTCNHKMKGGDGGSAPPCATACTVAPHPVDVYATCTGGAGANGKSIPEEVEIGGVVQVQEGTKGGDCYAFAGPYTAVSMGGGGGKPCGRADHFEVSVESGALEGRKLGKDISPEDFAEYYKDMGDLFDLSSVEHAELTELTDKIIQIEETGILNTVAFNTYKKLQTAQETYNAKMQSEVSKETASRFDLPDGTSLGAAQKATKSQMDDLVYLANAEAARGIGNELNYDVKSGQWVGSLDFYSAMTDLTKGYADWNTKMDIVLSLPPLKIFDIPNEQVCISPVCGSEKKCGTPGTPGRATNNCADATGIDTSPSGNGKSFNHIYSWTMPYAMNRLVYGEAGEAGEYKTTKIAKTTGELEIHLGVGGVWVDHKDPANGNWTKGKRGPDGTDTIVKMGGRNVLTAKGGKGGAQSLNTDRYDLCYAKEGTCSRDSGDITCCKNEIGKRSTKEILTTAGKMSAFENIKALTGNSLIIGIGLGRGGEGAGSRAQVEELKGLRVFRNSSGYGLNGADKILGPEGSNALDVAEKFKNYALAPSALNFKVGDVAVIITW
ncbi:MAG: hypothetical protein IJW73_01220, partial [Candidatus Gastranaerophilales bacterium]|nr:hypothetical protein [Candidatus Gastranaerophilales bacterium]